jgi:ankyrin repeat protein
VTQRCIARLGSYLVLVAFLSGCALIAPSHHRTEEYTPFFAAVSAGNLVEVQQDIDANPALIRATEWDSATPLHDAVGQNHQEVAQYLLGRGAQIDAKTKDGLTPLHMAAQNGNVPIIELLIRNGATLNPVDAKGWTPLDRAMKWDHPEAARVLSQHGAVAGR